MKKYLLLLLFALITTASFAQGDYQDVVYLKNGGVIRGIIIEQIPNKSIKIETVGKNIFVYPMDEIEKTTREAYSGKEINQSNKKSFQSGYTGNIEVVAAVNDELNSVKIDVVNGYQFNPYFSMGLGIGAQSYEDANITLVPIFANWKVNILSSKFSPYVSLEAGYLFNSTKDFRGTGTLANIVIGVNFKISDKTAINLGFGFETQVLDFYHDMNEDVYFYSNRHTVDLGRFNLGFSF